MNSMDQFIETNNDFSRSDTCIHNRKVLGLPPETKALKILWMYPSTLSLHGGRGDLMALLRFGTGAGLPVEICRIEHLNDTVPLEDADMLYFCCGDLSCVPDLIGALKPIEKELREFVAQGKMIVANGNSGAALSRSLQMLDGREMEGIGILDLRWCQRKSVHGDDIWMYTMDGLRVIGNEIKTADVVLAPGQAPFGKVVYGQGNCGDGFEGAVTGNVIYTGCLGPVLIRNPQLTMNLLYRAAQAAGMAVEEERFHLSPEDIPHETAGLDAAQAFIEKKMKK